MRNFFLTDHKFFLNVGPLKESIFLTVFYGLYFSHQHTNIIILIMCLFAYVTKCYFYECEYVKFNCINGMAQMKLKII